MSYGQNPQPPDWQQVSQAPAQPTQRSIWPWLVILAGLLMTGTLVCCGGGVAVMYFGFGVISAEVEDQLRDNERLREHIGEISEFELDWRRSFADDDDDTFTYSVKGNKGSGTVVVKHITNDDGDEEIVSARLRTSSGETIELVP